MKTCGYIVARNGALCTLLNVSGLNRGGCLLPGAPVAYFGKLRDARRAINRATKIAAKIKGSLIETWARERCPQIFDESAKYELIPIAKQ